MKAMHNQFKTQAQYDRCRISMQDMESSYIDGIITPDEAFDALRARGYSETMACRCIEIWRTKSPRCAWKAMRVEDFESIDREKLHIVGVSK